MAAYRRALEIDPGLADAHVNLGRLLHEQGETAEAERHYRQALAARPDDATAAFNLGVALQDLGRLREAADAYEAALAVDRTLADAHYNLAGDLRRAGRARSRLPPPPHLPHPDAGVTRLSAVPWLLTPAAHRLAAGSVIRSDSHDLLEGGELGRRRRRPFS